MKKRIRSKLAKRMEFTAKEREAIHKRDEETCIFCSLGYHMEYAEKGLEIMHIVPQSQMGMGVKENGALGCRGHHRLMDNGNRGLRPEMLAILEQRMRAMYPGWTRESVTYHKYPETRSRAVGEMATVAAGESKQEGREARWGSRCEPPDGFSFLPEGAENENTGI